MKSRLLALVLLLVLATGGCAPKSEPEVSSLKSSRVEQAPAAFQPMEKCPFTPQIYPNIQYQCGYLVVPEDRTREDSPKIKVAVVIYKSTGKSPVSDPLLIMVSNPSEELSFSEAFTFGFENQLSQRDLILMDVRGTGASVPAFNCAKIRELYYQTLDQDPLSKDLASQYDEALLSCRKDWDALTQNMAAYSTEEIAADIEDLRLALKIPKWNVYGLGYGSRLAYFLMRDYPDGLRSVILDTIDSPGYDNFSGSGAQNERVLKLFFQLCAENTACKSAYPDLEATFNSVYDQLTAHPLSHPVADSISGTRYTMFVDGNRLLNVVLMNMNYNMTDYLPETPRMIYQVKSGKYDRLAEMLVRLAHNNEPVDMGLQSRINCVERVQYLNMNQVKQADRATDRRITDPIFKGLEVNINSCRKVWGGLYNAQSTPSQVQIHAGIPILVLTGEQTAFTQPAWIKEVVSSGAGTQVDLASTGVIDWMFGGPMSECAKPIVDSFLSKPDSKPNVSCASQRKNITWITIQ